MTGTHPLGGVSCDPPDLPLDTGLTWGSFMGSFLEISRVRDADNISLHMT